MKEWFAKYSSEVSIKLAIIMGIRRIAARLARRSRSRTLSSPRGSYCTCLKYAAGAKIGREIIGRDIWSIPLQATAIAPFAAAPIPSFPLFSAAKTPA